MRNAIKAILLLSISACTMAKETPADVGVSQAPSISREEYKTHTAPSDSGPTEQPVAIVQPLDPLPAEPEAETAVEETAEDAEVPADEIVEPETQDLGIPIPNCSEHQAYDNAESRETRARVQAVCQEVGADPIICAYMDAVVVRESSGRSGVRHTKGKNENGLGAMGLSLRWHRDKWPGEDEDPLFCHPEVTAIVSLAIMHRAMQRYKAKNIVEIQAIYAGNWTCQGEGRERKCRARVTKRTTNVCGRMSARGFDCWKTLTKKDLGRKIPMDERREFVADMIARFIQGKATS